MNLDTSALQCFLAVSATGSFTKAALRINRTQSAVSQQILKLEHFIGKALFDRASKTLNLTSEGEIFQEYAQKILALHLEVIDRFNQPELEGHVRFGLPEGFAAVYLSDALVDFVRMHPRILLNIECDLTLNLFQRFKKKEFDIVLVKMSRPEEIPYGLEVWSEKLEWVGDKNVFLNFYNHQKFVPLVLSPEPCVYRSSTIRALEEASISWRSVFSSPSYSSTIAAVKAGLGITVLPRTMIPKELDALEIEFLPRLEDTHISLLKHDGNDLAIKSFEEFVLKKMKH